ncbi:MAG: FimB/Mfa2 family fimbrial subunit [Muribaculaceae bacterium]|nr:FimB/Mfa2 family fimbrial subunit [Muribaculaceae bacterium]
MINLRHTFKNLLAAVALTALAASGLSSCALINDDLDPCPEGVKLRFIYDYNMEFANAFPAKVDCLTLLVYDEAGNYIKTVTETSKVLADENWRMTIDLPAGKTYRFVAYGGLECGSSSFHFVQTPAKGSKITDLEVAMNQNCIDADPGVDLHNLYYGETTVTIPEGELDYTAGTVPMMRDTNTLRILLQNVDGTPCYAQDFDFRINTDNTLFAWNNDLIPVTGGNFYKPWAVGQSSVGTVGGEDEVSLAFAEFSTSRFVEGIPTRFIVTERRNNSVILDIPLVNYLLLFKSEKYKDMPAQEYLDRENHWDVILFLDNGRWIDAYIVVNDWIVRLNKTIM